MSCAACLELGAGDLTRLGGAEDRLKAVDRRNRKDDSGYSSLGKSLEAHSALSPGQSAVSSQDRSLVGDDPQEAEEAEAEAEAQVALLADAGNDDAAQDCEVHVTPATPAKRLERQELSEEQARRIVSMRFNRSRAHLLTASLDAVLQRERENQRGLASSSRYSSQASSLAQDLRAASTALVRGQLSPATRLHNISVVFRGHQQSREWVEEDVSVSLTKRAHLGGRTVAHAICIIAAICREPSRQRQQLVHRQH